MDQIISIILAEPSSVVFVALLKTVHDLGYAVRTKNRKRGVLRFRTGMSLTAWHGQEITAKLIARGDATTELRISGAFKDRCAVLYGLDWGDAKRTTRRIIVRTLRNLVDRSLGALEVIDPLWVCHECGSANAFWLKNCASCGKEGILPG